jgi:hypothetical protein
VLPSRWNLQEIINVRGEKLGTEIVIDANAPPSGITIHCDNGFNYDALHLLDEFVVKENKGP